MTINPYAGIKKNHRIIVKKRRINSGEK